MTFRPMESPSWRTVQHAGLVVAQCLDERRGPSEVMARLPALRAESAEVRAQVARLAQAVIGARRRLHFSLADRLPQNRLARAEAYVQMWLAERGVVVAGRGGGSTSGVDLPTQQMVAGRLAEIADPCERMAVRHSLPDWLARRFLDAFGDDSSQVLDGLEQAPPRTLRTNSLRVATRSDLLARLARAGVDAEPAQHADTAVHVRGTSDLFALDVYRDGGFEQQDEASQLAIQLTAPPPGGKVVDLCCGSGGKTLGLAAALRNRGAVLATDVHEGRIRELRVRLGRAGADNVRPLHLDGGRAAQDQLADFASRADRILIDAPCSGTGSWRRRPQARWAMDEAGLAELVEIQAQLLDQAAQWLKPKARLVYATCSLLPEENEEQVRRLCERQTRLESVRVVEILGGELGRSVSDSTGTFLRVRPDRHGCDGFFAAVLRRRRGIGS